MSLKVPAALLDRAKAGEVSNDEFIACVRDSLPYAWSVVSSVATELAETGGPFADNQTPPPDEAARGELLRLVASDAMRTAVEAHFNVRLAFQNCHRLAMFAPGADAEYQEFVTPRSQLLNQKPELVNC
ncbi:MAG TPA: SCO5389 family protein [Pseudonocardiaceae bacterium]|nr:SCO5389 family protein [Pseudonocardiaceae bacterium]